jgi:ribose-phosphate pyrophosphokinase
MYYTDVSGLERTPSLSTFPGGEEYVQVLGTLGERTTVRALLNSSKKVMRLFMLIDALRRARGGIVITLELPYLPYARQDRVCKKGEAFSLEVFGDILVGLGVDQVIVHDVHSKIAGHCVPNLHSISQATLAEDHADLNQWLNMDQDVPIYLICPDAGAGERSRNFKKAFKQIEGILYASKFRLHNAVQIVFSEELPRDIKGARLIIANDICDGGRTFTTLAHALIPCEPSSLCLFVTHGIFSAGKQVLYDAGFTDVFSTYEWPAKE